MENKVVAPFAKPLYVMLKTTGSVCNLACDYCYYLEKKSFYPDERRHMLSEELLEKFTKEYIESQTMPEILFTWHGGEALMRPLSFYKKAIEFQKKYGEGRIINNNLQTNGLLLNDDWCKFFKENNFLIGISIDGPQEFHDEYRRSKNGQPSFHKVMKGIELLKKHGVEYNALAVVNDYNVDYPLEVYNFFKSIDCRYIQFSPIVERLIPHTDGTKLTTPEEEEERIELAPFTVPALSYGKFLTAIFDEWVQNDVGTYYVHTFDGTLANWVGHPPGTCIMAKECGHAGVMEFNGDVYSCDHYVFPEYKLGNIKTDSLTSMMYSDQQKAFGADKHLSLPSQCKNCKFLFACNGECPKNRFLKTAAGEKGLNYLCDGFKHFFAHVSPYMDFMAEEYKNNRAPANVMQWAKERKNKKK